MGQMWRSIGQLWGHFLPFRWSLPSASARIRRRAGPLRSGSMGGAFRPQAGRKKSNENSARSLSAAISGSVIIVSGQGLVARRICRKPLWAGNDNVDILVDLPGTFTDCDAVRGGRGAGIGRPGAGAAEGFWTVARQAPGQASQASPGLVSRQQSGGPRRGRAANKNDLLWGASNCHRKQGNPCSSAD